MDKCCQTAFPPLLAEAINKSTGFQEWPALLSIDQHIFQVICSSYAAPRMHTWGQGLLFYYQWRYRVKINLWWSDKSDSTGSNPTPLKKVGYNPYEEMERPEDFLFFHSLEKALTKAHGSTHFKANINTLRADSYVFGRQFDPELWSQRLLLQLDFCLWHAVLEPIMVRVLCRILLGVMASNTAF